MGPEAALASKPLLAHYFLHALSRVFFPSLFAIQGYILNYGFFRARYGSPCQVAKYPHYGYSCFQRQQAQKLKRVIKNLLETVRQAHSIIILADNNIIFLEDIYKWVLAPFKDFKVRGVETYQRIKQIQSSLITIKVINWLLIDYIKRQNFKNLTTLTINNYISYLSDCWPLSEQISSTILYFFIALC